jgi:hypothetical protein
MSPVATATRSTPADILKYQNELVRTGKCIPLGRMQKIAIGPNASYTPPEHDPIIRKYGRFIDLREQLLPIAQSVDKSMILITAPLVDRTGRVGLPDLPDPEWVAPARSKEEIEGVKKRRADGTEYYESVAVDPARFQPKMIPQRLEDRTNEALDNDQNILVFQPVEYFTFQPEIKGRLVGDAWRVKCVPDNSTSPATHTALLVDRRTGEAHFFGGLFDIEGNNTSGQRHSGV